ncbi:MAG: tetratricopeptide repeat protein [Paracoccaceae bacterium]
MSETDSFIDEVSEEVRRDRLFALFRKYGWIAGLVIVGIVGGTGWTQWQLARDTAAAEAFGDATLDALDLGAPEDRIAALRALPAADGQGALVNLLLAADPQADRQAALEALRALGADAGQPEIYRDLANLRLVLIAGTEMPLAERRGILQAMAGAGRPYRVLALEQLAYLSVEEGDRMAAIAALVALMSDQEATASMKERLRQVITALGGSAPVAAAG